ncbi:MAG: endolytic transglycosylase MltG [Candidatus Nomurabacteria bacterium]|jgi:UPF0755 protein|nr:endolytic transglycosylase MltG [Candidatus Nomurabacteria bacterium]
MDIKRSKRQNPATVSPKPTLQRHPVVTGDGLELKPSGVVTPDAVYSNEQLSDSGSAAKKSKKWLKYIMIAAGALVLAAGLALGWYGWALSPIKALPSICANQPAEEETGNEACFIEAKVVEIKPGESADEVVAKLHAAGAIKSQLAFKIYLKLSGRSGDIKAGEYVVSLTYSVPEIVDQLTEGPRPKTFWVTFLPGGTLADAKSRLLKVGYSEAEIDTALAKTYDNPVLKDKPAESDLEGYIYGESYQFFKDVPVEQIIERCLEELERVVEENNLVAKFQTKGLTLHQGIILSSIVQREGGDDLPGVASVFLNRLSAGMNLGSDVTYQYIADKLGVERDPYLDNPYNTRRYPGLPPGPISSPGEKALLALASPSQTDYLFFLSGDDDKTYFAKTEAEHQRNIQQHCQKKCLIL